MEVRRLGPPNKQTHMSPVAFAKLDCLPGYSWTLLPNSACSQGSAGAHGAQGPSRSWPLSV
eukprot:3006845-Pyramimonas_sp.AAC.1